MIDYNLNNCRTCFHRKASGVQERRLIVYCFERREAVSCQADGRGPKVQVKTLFRAISTSFPGYVKRRSPGPLVVSRNCVFLSYNTASFLASQCTRCPRDGHVLSENDGHEAMQSYFWDSVCCICLGHFYGQTRIRIRCLGSLSTPIVCLLVKYHVIVFITAPGNLHFPSYSASIPGRSRHDSGELCFWYSLILTRVWLAKSLCSCRNNVDCV